MALLEVKNLSVGYRKPILEGISFSAEAGTIVGILGRNGCGKTTLLRGMAGSVRRFSGELLVAGRNCAAMTVKQQAEMLAVLPQQTQLLPGICARDVLKMGRYPYEGIFAPLAKHGTEQILEAAKICGIDHLLDRDCDQLSQGQRQMVLLARCLVQDTPVLLLDEPNTALDFDNTHAIFGALGELVQKKNKVALMVLHDPELALQYCHRLLILKDGRLTGDLTLSRSEQPQIEKALQSLYAIIRVRKDPVSGLFRCYHQMNLPEEGSQC